MEMNLENRGMFQNAVSTFTSKQGIYGGHSEAAVDFSPNTLFPLLIITPTMLRSLVHQLGQA
jgi:hypothetical protein